jgi:cbb3-type cytochrome oxidase maturation protein
MSMLYVALPVALLISVAALAAFAWTLRTGQLDDLETPPYRAIFDDLPEDGKGKQR